MNLYIIGAGGHGKVVADISSILKRYETISFFDDNKSKGSFILDYQILDEINYDKIQSLNHKDNFFFVAIGNSFIRKEIQNKLLDLKINIATIIHPMTSISKFSKIGLGTLICAGAIIGPDANIGKGCILNHSCTIDHDCNLGNYVHICPHSSLSGGVDFGDLSLLGTGARVIQGKKIGSNCTIGAGAVVINNIPNNKKAIGVPAEF